MTAIAFDGCMLAVDRASWKADYVWSTVKKLFVIKQPAGICRSSLGLSTEADGEIAWATAGEAADVPLILQWMKSGGEPPVLAQRDLARGLIVDGLTGGCYGLTGLLTAEPFIEPPVADGGGFQMALGAMLAGASAERAIEIVMERSGWAAGGVDVYRLPEHLRWKR